MRSRAAFGNFELLALMLDFICLSPVTYYPLHLEAKSATPKDSAPLAEATV